MFVQCFEVIDESLLRIGKTDRDLNCMKLRWQLTCAQADLLSSAVEYGMIPLESVKCFTHLVKKNFSVDVLSNHSSRKVKVQQFSGGESGLALYLFQVNRFLTCSSNDSIDKLNAIREAPIYTHRWQLDFVVGPRAHQEIENKRRAFFFLDD